MIKKNNYGPNRMNIKKIFANLMPALFMLIFFSQTHSMQLSNNESKPKTANDEGYTLERFRDKLPRTSNQCLFFRSIYDWKALNRYNLIIWSPGRNNPYHIELNNPCNGIRFAETIGFSSKDNRLCSYGGDSILINSSGGMLDRCTIGSITRLDKEGLERLVAQGRGRSLSEKQLEMQQKNE